MAEARRLERLNASHLFVLLWDDFGWSGDIGVLAILDGTRLLDRHGNVRIEAIRTLAVAVLSYAGQLNLTAVADGDACGESRCSRRACGAPLTSWCGRLCPCRERG